MRPGPYFLITLLLIAGGILIYHNLVADTSGPDPYDRHVSYETSELEITDTPSTSGDSNEPPLLHGGGNETLAQANAARVERLEMKYQALERLLAAASERPSGSSGSIGSAGTGTPLPSLSPRDIVDTDQPTFDDETVKTLAAYMDEINRRKNEERQRNRVSGSLAQLDLELTETEQQAIINETLRFQARRLDVMRASYSPDEAGRDARRAADQALRDEYATVIKRLVPEEPAEKILKSRVSRGVGFFGGAFGARGGSRRNRNR